MSRIVLGVSGSIAVYKACDLASKLVQAGHVVDVVMTRGSQRFVRPLAFAALTHRRPYTDRRWGKGAVPHDHLDVVAEADLLAVAPATANVIAKFAHGISDDILGATYLATTAPVLVAPAMNSRMLAHPRTQANLATLAADGVHVVGPDEGYLAEAETGKGRMTEPAALLERIASLLDE